MKAKPRKPLLIHSKKREIAHSGRYDLNLLKRTLAHSLTHHVVDRVVDRLDDLLFPLVLGLPLVHHVVDVHRPVEELGAQPLQEHRVGVLARQVGDEGLAGGAHVRHDEGGLRGLALVFEGVGADPDLVLGVGLCGRRKGPFITPDSFSLERAARPPRRGLRETRLRLRIAFIKPTRRRPLPSFSFCAIINLASSAVGAE